MFQLPDNPKPGYFSYREWQKYLLLSFHLSCSPNNWIAAFCVKAHFVAHITLCGPGACVFKVEKEDF